MIVSKNYECNFEVLRVSKNVDYVPKRNHGNETIKVETPKWELV